MPNAATVNTGTSGGTAQTTQTAKTQGAGGAIVPFRRATREHRELVNDSAYVLNASTQSPVGGSIGVPAYGYLRGLLITVVATGATGGTPVLAANGPWNILQNIMLSEPNGAPIFQVNDGYQIYLIDKYAGVVPAAYADPKGGIFTSATGNFQFQLYIPLELDLRDGLGSLPNQNAAAQFQLRYQLAPSATVYSTAPSTTLPNVQVTVEAMEYDQPQASTDGVANQTTPPAMNTTQFFTVQQYPVVAGFNRVRFTRVGNYIRNLGLIFTDGSGSRTVGDTNFPTSSEIDLDARPVDFIRKLTWRNTMYQRYNYAASSLDGAVNTQDSGVFWYDLCHEFDGMVGNENRDGWWKTYGSTRLEFAGSFGAAGTLTVITNDVAVAGNVFIN